MASSVGTLLLLLGLAASPSMAYMLPPMVGSINDTYSSGSPSSPLITRTRQRVTRDTQDPTDFGWIRKWAAIGDSFTSGIGSGTQMGKLLSADWKCSRYSYAWPAIVNQALGPSVESGGYHFKACAGARTGGIVAQANELSSDLDVVMMTAGGNDLCLAGIIGECIFDAYEGEQACEDVLTKAQTNIDTILKPNIRLIFDALDAKINENGVLVHIGYAPYFNTANEDCADPAKQAWNYHLNPSHWFATSLRLTKARRQRFNTLVDNVNTAIREVVEEADDAGTHPYRLVYADWSHWPAEVDGQMCSPASDGKYPDPNQPNLHFIKPDTYSGPPPSRDYLRRDLDGSNGTDYEAAQRQAADDHAQMLYDSAIFRSPNPLAVARRELEARIGAVPAACPGDNTAKEVLGMGLPDSFLSNFHPNERGHETIAATALDNLIRARSKVLGIEDSCPMPEIDSLQCEGKATDRTQPRPHVGVARLVQSTQDFCRTFKIPPNTINWNVRQTFFQGTPEEHDLVIQLSDSLGSIDRSFCRESFDRLIHSCDGNDPGNPMNVKFGGRWQRGAYEFRIEPSWTWRRPLATRTDGICNSHQKGGYARYYMSGRGWATWDWGESKDGFLAQIKRCTGKLTNVHWKYCEWGECEGEMDWEMSFDTNIWVRKKCFDNLRVQGASAGYTHKYKHVYPVWGCSGSD